MQGTQPRLAARTAPTQGQWLNAGGHKSIYDDWLKYGYDSIVIQDGTVRTSDNCPSAGYSTSPTDSTLQSIFTIAVQHYDDFSMMSVVAVYSMSMLLRLE